MKRNVVVYMMGSHGDVHPLISIGKGLAKSGWTPIFVSNSYFQKMVESEGFEFFAVTDAELYTKTYQSKTMWTKKGLFEHTIGYHVPAMVPTFRLIEKLHVERNISLVVGTGHFGGASWAADYLRVPYIRISLAPHMDKDVQLSEFEKLSGIYAIGQKSLIVVLTQLSFLVLNFRLIFPKVNAARRALGLKKTTFSKQYKRSLQYFSVALYPTWFMFPQSQSKLRENLAHVGFLCSDPIVFETREAVKKIIDALPEAPIAFAPGSAVFHVGDYIKQAEFACRTLKRVGFFVCKSDRPAEKISEYLYRIDYVDFSFLFQYCALVCHHGGIGTTAQCFRAGVPQLVRPMIYDQPDNARRIMVLGVGTIISPKSSAKELTEKIKDILQVDSYAKSAARFREAMHNNSALDSCVRLINQFYISNKFKMSSPTEKKYDQEYSTITKKNSV